MKINFKKNIIITGHFASGKTEIAANIAKKLRDENKKICIVDFDIVNPFYRTNDLKDYFKSNNIDLIAPIYSNTNVDVPSIPASINKVFDSKNYDHVIFDIGGDDLGAKIVSSYKEKIINDNNYEHLCVLNLNRPLTDNFDSAKEMLNEIENSAKIKIDYIINNSMIIGDASIKEFNNNKKICEKIAKEMKIKVKFHVIDYNNKFMINEHNILKLKRYLKNPWD